MSNYYLTREDELYHHGIMGMKWGQRRFQNADGTYTAEGKARRRLSDTTEKISNNPKLKRAFEQNVKQGKDKPNTSPAGQIAKSTGDIANRVNNIVKRNSKIPKEDLTKYSDSELQKKVNRMRLEQQYSDLKKETINTGAKKVSDVIDTIGDIAAIGVSAAMIYTMIRQIKG